jgi:7-cyano-7-deazaguanine synthase in queuosine biosynthesis
MKVDITISEPRSAGYFSDIALGYLDDQGNSRTVNMYVTYEDLNAFNGNTSSIEFDLYLIGIMVYGIDNLLLRYQYSIDGWAREIEVSFPVNNANKLAKVAGELVSVLTFLTGDHWNVSFNSNVPTTFFKKRETTRSSPPMFDKNNLASASLFSGGLDSLVGVIDALKSLKSDKSLLLISHYDSESSGANADQVRLEKHLSKNFTQKTHWVQSCVSLSRKDSNGIKLQCEPSMRSRSLLFISMGVYALSALPNNQELLIPENGTISLNFPLTPSRSSTLSTRTTHPYFLDSLQKLLTKLGITTKLKNPYWNKTKGELLKGCSDKKTLQLTYNDSVSCGKRGRRGHWDKRSGTNHCGVCMPCIYRRAALHVINADSQLYGIDIFKTKKKILDIEDLPALFDFLKSPLSNQQIKRILLVNGSLSLVDLDHYSNVVERVRKEVKKWLADKGNAQLKELAGIK